MSAYRLSSPYERSPLRRRVSGLALALAANLLILLILLTLNRFAPDARKVSQALVVDFLPESHSAATERQAPTKPVEKTKVQPLPKPPITLPAKPTITLPPQPPKPAPFIEMSSADLAAGDLRNLPKAGAGDGDSEVVGKGPHGEVLYAAEWARHPTDAELGGYLPKNAPDGFGLIACRQAQAVAEVSIAATAAASGRRSLSSRRRRCARGRGCALRGSAFGRRRVRIER